MAARVFRCFTETKWTMGTEYKPGDVVAVPFREIIANPNANAEHSPRCVAGDWPSMGMCYCQGDDREPDEILAEVRAALAEAL